MSHILVEGRFYQTMICRSNKRRSLLSYDLHERPAECKETKSVITSRFTLSFRWAPDSPSPGPVVECQRFGSEFSLYQGQTQERQTCYKKLTKQRRAPLFTKGMRCVGSESKASGIILMLLPWLLQQI